MEARLFNEGTIPEWTTPDWYAEREAAPHLEQEGHRERLLVVAEYAETAYAHGARSLVDLGSGDGGLLSLVTYLYPNATGYDLQQSNVDAAAARGVKVQLKNVIDDDWPDADVVVASEMLEHLIDPHEFVRKIASKSKFLIASSPYTETADSHYEFHTWAWDREGYRQMIEDAGYEILRRSDAWICQIVLARRIT